jgi:arginyl-tRNA synthetase
MVLSRLARLLSDLSAFRGHSLPALQDALVIPPQRKIASLAVDLSRLDTGNHVDRARCASLAGELAAAPEIARCVAVFPRLYFDLERSLAVRVLEAALSGAETGRREENRGKLINVSFCSPNANKSLHLGHARNMFLGMAISRICERAGYDVFRTCNYSDAGIHIMKAFAAFMKMGATEELRALPADVAAGRCYQAFTAAPDEFADPQDLLDRSLHPGSPLAEAVREWTSGVIARFEETFAEYGVSFHWTLRESDNLPVIEEMIRDLDARGLLERQENGDAFVAVPAGAETEKVFLLRGGGSPLYMSQLLASGIRRFARFGTRLERIYALAGMEQKEVFALLNRVQEHCAIPCARRYGYYEFGLVFHDGTRLRSREATYSLDDLWRALLPKASEFFARAPRRPRIEEYCRAHIAHFFLKKERQQSFDFRARDAEWLGKGCFWDVCRSFADLLAASRGAPARVLDRGAEEQLLQLLLRYPAAVTDAAAALDPAPLVRFGLKIAGAFQAGSERAAVPADPWSRRLAGIAAHVLADSARLCNLDLERAAILTAPPPP